MPQDPQYPDLVSQYEKQQKASQPPPDLEMPQLATSPRVPKGGYKVGDPVQMFGKTMYVTGIDQQGRPDLDFQKPLPKYAKPGPYQTKLNSAQETEFQKWVKTNKVPFEDGEQADYDMRGYFKAMKAGDPRAQQAANKHFPDVWKTPYHKTFSNESMYALPGAPRWVDNRLIDEDGNVVADESKSFAPTPDSKYPNLVQQYETQHAMGTWGGLPKPVNRPAFKMFGTSFYTREQVEAARSKADAVSRGQARYSPEELKILQAANESDNREAAVLAAAKKYAVDPFDRMRDATERELKDIAEREMVFQRYGVGGIHQPPATQADIERYRREHGKEAGIVRGVAGVTGGVVGDPRYWPLMFTGEGVISKALNAGFTVQMAHGSYEQAKQLHEIWNRTDVPEDQKYELMTGAVVSAIMAAHMTYGTLRGGHKVPAPLPEDVAKEINSLPEDVRKEIFKRVQDRLGRPFGTLAAPTPTRPHPDLVTPPDFREPGEMEPEPSNLPFNVVDKRGQPQEEGIGVQIIDAPVLSPEERMFRRQEEREQEVRDLLAAEREQRERDVRGRESKYRDQVAEQMEREAALEPKDQRRVAPTELIDLRERMEELAHSNMYENATDMARSLLEKKPRGVALQPFEKDFLRLWEERKRVVSGVTGAEGAERTKFGEKEAQEEGSRIEREQKLREASARLSKEAAEAKTPEAVQEKGDQADEALRRAEELKTEADRARAEREAAQEQQQHYPAGAPVAMAADGAKTEVRLPDGRKLAAHYAVVKESDLVTSHDAHSFEWNKKYQPAKMQPRDYSKNKEARHGVIAGGQDFDLNSYFNTDNTGHNGPSVMFADGRVPGGNGRAMRLMRAYRIMEPEAIRAHLVEKASHFGIDPEKIPPAEDHPFLVRVLDDTPEDLQSLIDIGQDLNRDETRGFSAAEQAVMSADRLSTDTLEWLSRRLDGMGEDASIRDLMRAYPIELFQKLANDGVISPTKRAEFLTGKNELTERTKDLFENAMLGKVINDADLIATMPKSIRDKLFRSLAALSKIKAADRAWDFTDYLEEAVRHWKRMEALTESLEIYKGENKSTKYMAFQNAKMIKEPIHPAVEALIRYLDRKPLEIKEGFYKYIDDYEGRQSTLMGIEPPNPRMSFNQHIGEKVGVEVSQGEWGTVKPVEKPETPAPPVEAAKPKKEETPAPVHEDMGADDEAHLRDAPLEDLEADLAQLEQLYGKDDPITQAYVREIARRKKTAAEMEPTPAEAEQAKAAEEEVAKVTADVDLSRKLSTAGPLDEEKLREILSQHPNYSAGKVGAVVSVMKAFAEKYAGMSFNDWLNSKIARVEIMGEGPKAPGEPEAEKTGALFQRKNQLLPGFEQTPDERKTARAEYEGEQLSKAILEKKGDISRMSGDIERHGPLFAAAGASGQADLFGMEPTPEEQQLTLEPPPEETAPKEKPAIQQKYYTANDGTKLPLIDPEGRELHSAQVATMWANEKMRAKRENREPKFWWAGEKPETPKPPDTLFQHGEGMASVEELARGEKFWRVKRNGEFTYQGVQPDANLGEGEALIAVKADGSMRVQDTRMGLSDAQTLDRARPRILGALRELGRPLYQSDPVWFSQAERVVSEKMKGPMSGDQLLGMLNNAGIKAEEMKWTGLDDYLKGKKRVTPEEVREFIKQNAVQVEEVEKGAPRYMRDAAGRTIDDGAGGLVENLNATKYGEDKRLQIPGGENYRELLLTLPEKEPSEVTRLLREREAVFNKMQTAVTAHGHPSEPQTAEYAELKRQFNELDRQLGIEQAKRPQPFKAGHFNEKNVLAHIRFNDRVDADGKKVLFLEEVQSDWHQKGRKQGYADAKRAEELQREYDDYIKGVVSGKVQPDVERFKRLQYELVTAKASPIPDAPFKTTWHELAMKRMLRYAAENGYNRLAWTTGEQQADRYDLSKQVDSIKVVSTGGTYKVEGFKDGRHALMERDVKPQDLPNLVGKDLANKIIADSGATEPRQGDEVTVWHQGELVTGKFTGTKDFGASTGTGFRIRRANGSAFYATRDDLNTRVYQGKDLQVGGQGMRSFYDKIIPDFLNKYGKKWGAKVGKTDIQRPTYREVEPDAFGDYTQPVESSFAGNEQEPVHSIDVTPEMKTSVMRGQPVFQANKGAVEFAEDGRAIIHLMENADVSTILHEFAHVARRNLKPEDQTIVNDWLKIKDGQWHVVDEEKFARAFEKYLYDGEAPTSGLKAVFQRIRDWMIEVYQAVKGSSINIRFPEEVRRVFDRMLAGEDLEEKPEKSAKPGKSVKATIDDEARRIQKVQEDKGEAVTPDERMSATKIAEGGEAFTDKMTDARMRVFPDQEQAIQWAKANQEKIRGIQLYMLQDGRGFAHFLPKDPNVLFQEVDPAEIDRRIRMIDERMQKIIPDAERAKLAKMRQELMTQKSKRDLALSPTPGAGVGKPIKLWTPEGEREITSEPGKPDTERGVSHPPGELQEPRGAEPVPERARESRGAGEDRPAGRGVRGSDKSGRAKREAGGPREALRDVKPAQLDAPTRDRGTDLYTKEQWTERTKLLRLPTNAPPPTVRLPNSLRRMLIFPGQSEVVEMALSGLKQHDAFIIATTTGTGKTYTGSAILSQLAKPDMKVLVLTTSKDLIHQRGNGWIAVARDFDVDINELPPGEAVPDEPGVYITTYATAIGRQGIEHGNWDLVVSDEIGEARKWYSSQRGAMMKTLAGNAKKVLYMSATPFHTALELGHMDKLGLWREQGFATWGKQFGIYRDEQGNWAGGNAPKKLMKLREQLIERGQFVNVDRNMEGFETSFAQVPLTPYQVKDLRNITQAFGLAEDYFKRIKKKSMIRAVRGNAVTYVKKYLERSRLPQAIELMKKLDKEGWKTILFSETKSERSEIFDFLQPVDEALGGRLSELLPPLPEVPELLEREFGEQLANYSGPHSAYRTAEKEAFLDDSKRHIYVSYAAGGIGVSLHDTVGTKPRAVIYLGPPYSGVMFDQAIGRAWRYGTKSNVHAIFMTSNARPEIRLVLEKVAPRMTSLRALVSGVDTEDKFVNTLRNMDSTREGQFAYELGNKVKVEAGDFIDTEETHAIQSWKDVKIQSAETAKDKGMKFPEEPAGGPAVIRLFQEDEYEPPEDFEVPEEQEAAAENRAARQRFEDGDEVPLPAPNRTVLADDIETQAMADAKESPSYRAPAVRLRWDSSKRYVRTAWDAVEGSRPVKAAKVQDLYWMTNGRKVIRDVAAQVGAGDTGIKIARMLPEYHIEWGNISGPWVHRYFEILKDNDISTKRKVSFRDPKTGEQKEVNEHHAMTMAIEGKNPPANPRIAKAVEQTRKLLSEVRARLAKENVSVEIYDGGSGQKRYVPFSEIMDDPNYWPHKFDPEYEVRFTDPDTGEVVAMKLKELIGGELGENKRQRIIKYLQREHKLTLAQAEDFLEGRKRDHPLVGNVERSRDYDLPFYRTDPGAMISYLEGAGEASARTRVFGQRRQKLENEITRVPNVKARARIREIMDSVLSKRPFEDETKDFVSFAADWSVLTKMTFSSLKALGHSVHAATSSNIRAYLRGFLESTPLIGNWKEAKENAIFSGAILEQYKTEMLREYGAKRKIASKYLDVVGFQGMYEFGRVASDATARIFLEKYALPKLMKGRSTDYYRRTLKEVYLLDDKAIDGAIDRGAWAEEDLHRAGKALSDKTMFTFDPSELPPAWRARSKEPIADNVLAGVRVMTLLKGYMFKTSALLRDRLIDEAKKGNFRPWIPFLLAYPVMGEIIADLGAVATLNKKRWDDLMNDKESWESKILYRLASNMAHATGLTLVDTILEAAFRQNSATYAARDTYEFFAGPFLADAIHTFVQFPMELMAAKTTKRMSSEEKRFNSLVRWARATFPVVAIPVNFEKIIHPPKRKGQHGSGTDYHFTSMPTH